MKRLIITFISVLWILSSVESTGSDNRNRTKLTVRNESLAVVNSGEVYRD